MSKALERRAKFREELILAAERSMSAGGLAGLNCVVSVKPPVSVNLPP
jgi:hypothetical protein